MRRYVALIITNRKKTGNQPDAQKANGSTLPEKWKRIHIFLQILFLLVYA